MRLDPHSYQEEGEHEPRRLLHRHGDAQCQGSDPTSCTSLSGIAVAVPSPQRNDEERYREKRAADRRLKAARFPTLKTLDTFDFTARPSVNKMLITELARGEFIDKRENVLLVGNPGTGKSHLATALAVAACHKGYKVRFYRATELVTALIEARDERSFLRLKNQLAKLDLLVLDELGYVPASKVGAELLFDVISTAYERTSLIVTTNLPFESWTEVLGSERLTGAALDRLTHRCRIIETKGESYRLHDAKTRTRRTRNPDPVAKTDIAQTD